MPTDRHGDSEAAAPRDNTRELPGTLPMRNVEQRSVQLGALEVIDTESMTPPQASPRQGRGGATAAR